MDNKTPVTIGRISACIAGDHRYTDTLTLTYDPVSHVVTCEVRSTTASGGMDGPGGTDPARLLLSRSTLADPTPRQVLLLAKDALARPDFSFARYGKPTKRFCWSTLDGDKQGLSQALAHQALVYATWKPEPINELLL
jgi:hypothetical protein